MDKPSWADQVTELTAEEATALCAMGIDVYWDYAPWYYSLDSFRFLSVEDSIRLAIMYGATETPDDNPVLFFFTLKESD